MTKVNNRTSTLISIFVSAAVFVFIAVMMCALPFVIDTAPIMQEILSYFDGSIFGISGSVIFWVWIYVVLAVAEVCCILVFALLIHVRKGLVFTQKSVRYIYAVSWGCLIIALACVAVCNFFKMALVVALAAGFLGLCVRVVKNVIEEANAIKDENDLTV